MDKENYIPYIVQCINGDPSHVMQAKRGSELEAKCIKRSERMLDAFTFGPDDCPSCVREDRDRFYRELDVYGCPNEDEDGNCTLEDCVCKATIPDSKWDDQGEGIADYEPTAETEEERETSVIDEAREMELGWYDAVHRMMCGPNA